MEAAVRRGVEGLHGGRRHCFIAATGDASLDRSARKRRVSINAALGIGPPGLRMR
jgi:hypothetical protein